MYGKAFSQMYTGSMYGAGLHVFAVWGWVIAHTHHSDDSVEINPKLLAAALGGSLENIVDALAYLCAPDKHSRSPEEDGRRLVKEGEFVYRVVNAEKYHKMQDDDARRESSRTRKRKQRSRDVTPGHTPSQSVPSKSHQEEVKEEEEVKETKKQKTTAVQKAEPPEDFLKAKSNNPATDNELTEWATSIYLKYPTRIKEGKENTLAHIVARLKKFETYTAQLGELERIKAHADTYCKSCVAIKLKPKPSEEFFRDNIDDLPEAVEKYNPVAVWCEEYKRIHRVAPIVTGKDAGILTALAKGIKDEIQWRKMIVKYLKCIMQKYVDSGWPTGMFAATINTWKIEVGNAYNEPEQQRVFEHGGGDEESLESVLASARAESGRGESGPGVDDSGAESRNGCAEHVAG